MTNSQAPQPAPEPVATLWREQRQDLYPGPLFDLTDTGKALPLGVKHKLYAEPVQAPAVAPAIPAGWNITRDEDTGPGCIRVFSPILGPGGTTLAPPGGSLAYRLLYALCNDLLGGESDVPVQGNAQ